MRAGVSILIGAMLIAGAAGAQPASAPGFGRMQPDAASPLLPPPVLANAQRLRDRAMKGDDVAYDLLEGLTTEIGQRLAATDAEHRAAEWMAVKLKAMGFQNVHLEPFTMDVWTRGVETAEVTAPFPQRLVITALGKSVATPPEGIEAEAVVFKTYDELLAAPVGSLTGKIAVVTQPMPRASDGAGYGMSYMIRSLGPSEAAKRGAVGYLLRSLATNDQRLPHTGALAYLPGAPQIPAAALSVPDAEQLDRIAKRGRPIRIHMTVTPTTRPGGTSYTVVGDILGREKPDELVLIGGHLDSWDLGTGAIDDGAGVAITTAAAKLIGDLPRHPRRTIRLALFGAEEVGVAETTFAAAHPAAEQSRMVVAQRVRLWRGPHLRRRPAQGRGGVELWPQPRPRAGAHRSLYLARAAARWRRRSRRAEGRAAGGPDAGRDPLFRHPPQRRRHLRQDRPCADGPECRRLGRLRLSGGRQRRGFPGPGRQTVR